MKNIKSNRERIHDVANKMGLEFVNNRNGNILNSKMLNISKSERSQVKEELQRQLENVVGSKR